MKSTIAALLLTSSLHFTAAFSTSQFLLRNVNSAPKQCPVDVELSCHNTRPVEDTCCFNAPGGLILLTQFWDAQPATGPEDSWTLHGLWPDNCDGSFEQYCDKNREYKNVTDILQSHGKEHLLEYMSTYWKDWKGNDENLWEHEWNKHGTCISTLETRCYSGYKPQAEVVDYFEKAAEMFEGLDTYKVLAAAGIEPHPTKTYTLTELQDAISKSHGMEVTLNCRDSRLNEVWYFFNVKGSLQSGTYVPTKPGGASSTCPESGIKYLPKGGSSPTSSTRSGEPTSTGSSPSPTGTGGAFQGKGHLEVTSGNKRTGCLISYGTWYSTGTCATFTATRSGDGFTLRSSKGDCGIRNSVFECDTDVEPSVFTADDEKLAFGGSSTFSADETPRGTTQVPIYTGGRSIELTIGWKRI
ncbi:Ribonuclease Trv, putative [Coccidioides posadasii C735 delta SOWgp]|uniref:Ribonuclease T2-like n=1 Tax=Coccidioides posadasii (strain C735) TaxID=222929 RepID=C5P0L4_COCP7|nr:Ribonuclease Trv, putative [Coccidioides posadasii C735 delta SOWgp]EER29222.1 Ribonuclease Trv, putative [Coccidioides posadasii C735 delta SOWgp]|eukprot:XP_003071367.1 Ribonuclease Trv, putative [Coccidioides posadasii C735 delta SOWgp]